MANMPPTKGNLMAAKRSRALAATGWELMDKKRNILTRELMDRMDRAAALQSEIDDIFNAAYGALAIAEIATGSVTGTVSAVKEDDSLRLRWRSVMGVEIPELEAGMGDWEELPYALVGSSSALDEAYRRFARVKELLAERFDAVVDFMIYTTDSFAARMQTLLNCCGRCGRSLRRMRCST